MRKFRRRRGKGGEAERSGKVVQHKKPHHRAKAAYYRKAEIACRRVCRGRGLLMDDQNPACNGHYLKKDEQRHEIGCKKSADNRAPRDKRKELIAVKPAVAVKIVRAERGGHKPQEAGKRRQNELEPCRLKAESKGEKQRERCALAGVEPETAAQKALRRRKRHGKDIDSPFAFQLSRAPQAKPRRKRQEQHGYYYGFQIDRFPLLFQTSPAMPAKYAYISSANALTAMSSSVSTARHRFMRQPFFCTPPPSGMALFIGNTARTSTSMR